MEEPSEVDTVVAYEVVYRDHRACPRIYARTLSYDEARCYAELCEGDHRRDPRFPVRIRKEGEE